MEHLAIDLGGKESQICVRSSDGPIVEDRRCRTATLPAYLAGRPKGRVVVETCLVGLALTLVSAIVLGSEPGAAAQSKQSPKGLEGTWHVTVTPYNCLTKLPLGFSFHALLAFTSRGNTEWGEQRCRTAWPVQRVIRGLGADRSPPLPRSHRGLHPLPWWSVSGGPAGDQSLDPRFCRRRPLFR
jgi:hypothetical protein